MEPTCLKIIYIRVCVCNTCGVHSPLFRGKRLFCFKVLKIFICPVKQHCFNIVIHFADTYYFVNGICYKAVLCTPQLLLLNNFSNLYTKIYTNSHK